MLPVNPGGHAAYQNHDSIASSTWTIIDRFWNLNLSSVDSIMQDQYSVFGPKPRLPSCMLRSILLSIAFKVPAFTAWANQLKLNPLYAILSGFEFGKTPGTGTFYDFFTRLWNSTNINISVHQRPLKKTVKKPSKKGTKADSVEKITVDQLIASLEMNSPDSNQPYSKLFEIFKLLFLDESINRNLIDPHNLALSRDGTPVVTSARQRKKRICNCKKKTALPIATVTDTFFNRIAMWDGTLHEIASIMATISICLPLQIQKAIYQYSLY